MTITYTIPGATTLDQLNEPTMDGMADENASDNCVAASIAEALHILTGKTYDGDELKDAVYGQGYVGFQSASRYVTYCHNQGVTLSAHNDTQAGLVNEIHAQVSEDHPVLVTMPSQWGTPYSDPVHPSGSTHVGVMVGVGPGMLRCMNPWHGFMQDEADAWWEPRLCEGQVWILQKAGANVSAVPNGWSDDGTTLKAPNGNTVTQGFRDEVLNWPGGWEADNVPLENARGETPSAMGLSGTHGTRQTFAYRLLGWSDAEGVQAHVWLGQMFLTSEAATASAQQDVQSAKALAASLNAQLDTANSQIAQLQAQIATLKSQPAPTPPAPPAPVANPAPTTIPDATALLVTLIYAEAAATIKAAS